MTQVGYGLSGDLTGALIGRPYSLGRVRRPRWAATAGTLRSCIQGTCLPVGNLSGLLADPAPESLSKMPTRTANYAVPLTAFSAQSRLATGVTL
jgi:hypothetical protein